MDDAGAHLDGACLHRYTQRLIKKFGGEIRLESPEGQGTTCVITLPADKAGVRKEEPCVSP